MGKYCIANSQNSRDQELVKNQINRNCKPIWRVEYNQLSVIAQKKGNSELAKGPKEVLKVYKKEQVGKE